MTSMRRIGVVLAAGVALTLSLLAGPRGSHAQDGEVERITTLLAYVAQYVDRGQPTSALASTELAIAADARKQPVKQVYLRFYLGALPAGARVTGWTLRLEVATRGTDLQRVQVFPVPSWTLKTRQLRSDPVLMWSNRPRVDKAAALVEVTTTSESVDFELKGPDGKPWVVPPGQQDVFLMLQSQTSSVEYTYRGLCGAMVFGWCENVNRQPRLIVRYKVPEAATAVTWQQPDHDAQQSRRSAWRPPAPVTEVVIRDVISPGGYIVGPPTITRKGVIVNIQRDTGGGAQQFLMTLVEDQPRSVSSVVLSSKPTFPPIVDRTGGIGVVTEQAWEQVATVADRLAAPVIPNPWGRLEPGADVRVRAAPTMGTDNALYVPTNRGLFGMFALKWRVSWRFGDASTRVGRVALSADDRTAYAVVVDQGNQAAGIRCGESPGTPGAKPGAMLVAIDTVNGRPLWRAGAFGDPGDGGSLPVPIVTTLMVSNNDVLETHTVIYAIDGHEYGTTLQMFDGRTGQCRAMATTGRFSRPVADVGRGVVYVREEPDAKGRLCRVWWLAWFMGGRPMEECQLANAGGLSPLSVLAVDASGNIYAIDATTDPQKVRGYRRAFTPLFELDVPATRSAAEGRSMNFGDNLVIGPGGRLFATNWNTLFAIEPKK